MGKARAHQAGASGGRPAAVQPREAKNPNATYASFRDDLAPINKPGRKAARTLTAAEKALRKQPAAAGSVPNRKRKQLPSAPPALTLDMVEAAAAAANAAGAMHGALSSDESDDSSDWSPDEDDDSGTQRAAKRRRQTSARSLVDEQQEDDDYWLAAKLQEQEISEAEISEVEVL